jgi:hypothetical protein
VRIARIFGTPTATSTSADIRFGNPGFVFVLPLD